MMPDRQIGSTPEKPYIRYGRYVPRKPSYDTLLRKEPRKVSEAEEPQLERSNFDAQEAPNVEIPKSRSAGSKQGKIRPLTQGGGEICEFPSCNV